MAIYRNPARRAWWSVHVSAWRQSGLSETAYCCQHGLLRKSFVRWLKALDAWETARKLARERRKRWRAPASKSQRNRAVQAFWAMHVEAMRWSNLSVRVYAHAHHLSPNSLYRWCNLIESRQLEIDWRALLHPSARPAISTKIEPSAKEAASEACLTEAAAVDPTVRAKLHRRRFSIEEKRAILLEAKSSGMSLSAVGRAHGISTSMLFRWRVELGMNTEPPALFATVKLRSTKGSSVRRDPASKVAVLDDLLPAPKGAALVELADGRSVFAPAHINPEAVRRAVSRREAEL